MRSANPARSDASVSLAIRTASAVQRIPGLPSRPHPRSGPNVPQTPADIEHLKDLAAEAGISRIHVLAWRDLDDVEAGGSEVHAHEVCRRWAEAGIEVSMRTSFAADHPPRVRRDGYEVVRKAGRYMVFPRAAVGEALGRYGRRDALVEIWNGMPFFSPVWSGRRPRVVVMHHVHADMWKMVLPPNLARLGDLLESRVAPRIYRGSRMITLSPSSRDEMLDIGFRDERIEVVPPGIDDRFAPGGEPDPDPLVVAVGRLVPVKRFDRLLRIIAEIADRIPRLRVRIVGTGPEYGALADLVDALGLTDTVVFTGRIEDDELVDLYRRAWVVASASVREGWGMTLTEAAACGTPAVATRIPGHVDAVADGLGGILVDDPSEFAVALERVLTDADLRSRLREGALDHAAGFSWNNTATRILTALHDEALGVRPGRGRPERPD